RKQLGRAFTDVSTLPASATSRGHKTDTSETTRATRRLYSFNLGEPLGENCTASIVELDSMRVLAELTLPGRPRWALYDRERDVVYANIQQPAQIVVIDCERLLIERALEVPSTGPHGLWLDSGRLVCAADGG